MMHTVSENYNAAKNPCELKCLWFLVHSNNTNNKATLKINVNVTSLLTTTSYILPQLSLNISLWNHLQ